MTLDASGASFPVSCVKIYFHPLSDYLGGKYLPLLREWTIVTQLCGPQEEILVLPLGETAYLASFSCSCKLYIPFIQNCLGRTDTFALIFRISSSSKATLCGQSDQLEIRLSGTCYTSLILLCQCFLYASQFCYSLLSSTKIPFDCCDGRNLAGCAMI